MLTRSGGASAWERLVENPDIGNRTGLQPSPVGQILTTCTANLITEKFDDALMYAVIVRFDNSLFAAIAELKQAFLLNGLHEQRVGFRRHLSCKFL